MSVSATVVSHLPVGPAAVAVVWYIVVVTVLVLTDVTTSGQ